VPNVGAIPYRGRFAPSPTGPLHAGSLVAALASWLDARAHGGSWLVRVEDVDTPRCVAGADKTILEQLAACGLLPDESPTYQSKRSHLYQQALAQLVAQDQAYPCTCTRLDITDALAASGHPRQRHDELVYPGTCRAKLGSCLTEKPQTWRFLTSKSPLKVAVAQQIRAWPATELIAYQIASWTDRRLGVQSQNVTQQVGDFVVQRADGLWAYQLAVVVDDAVQGITHVVRGEDLAGNTARQILLQRALGLPAPHYLHTPLVLAADGKKLSKQNGAQPLDTTQPVTLLKAAGQHLGITIKAIDHTNTSDWLCAAIEQWRLKME
jgi:glutamyl-Q tRNA(Asp) synthetase